MATYLHMDDSRRKYLREEYVARINRVIDHIETNIDADLSLESLAAVANFSPFHFHRLFRAFLGETPKQFILRVRLEKAAAQLTANPKKSITEIAFDCGFSGSATFARAFKEAFQVSASEWRLTARKQDRKICKTIRKNNQTVGKNRKDLKASSLYGNVNINQIQRRMNMLDESRFQIEVKDMPDLNVAYIRHIGPYKGDSHLFESLFGKLFTWAGPRGLVQMPGTQVLTVYHDDPKVTAEDKQRISVCITVPEKTAVDGEIGQMKISGGRFAVAHFEITSSEYEHAWNAVYGGWLPESGYQPADGLCYELMHNDPNAHPQQKHIVDICIPVKPL